MITPETKVRIIEIAQSILTDDWYNTKDTDAPGKRPSLADIIAAAKELEKFADDTTAPTNN